MSADLLREAANLMRERAKAADHLTSPWSVGDWEDGWSISYTTDHPLAGHVAQCADYVSAEAAEHIASWHPAVALAVADSLVAAAAHVESYDCEAHCEPGGCELVLTATRTARAYLGGAA